MSMKNSSAQKFQPVHYAFKTSNASESKKFFLILRAYFTSFQTNDLYANIVKSKRFLMKFLITIFNL